MTKHITHFWIGHFDSENLFNEFFEETYTENDDDPISKFSSSQDEIWIDHDFLEVSYEDNDKTLMEKFGNNSYAEEWMETLAMKVKDNGISKINTLVLLWFDKEEGHIENPKTTIGKGFELNYLGPIEFET